MRGRQGATAAQAAGIALTLRFLANAIRGNLAGLHVNGISSGLLLLYAESIMHALAGRLDGAGYESAYMAIESFQKPRYRPLDVSLRYFGATAPLEGRSGRRWPI